MNLVDLPSRARTREERAEYLSIERVYEETPDGRRVLLYPIGSPVPYEEAVRQGIADPVADELSDDDAASDETDGEGETPAGGDASGSEDEGAAVGDPDGGETSTEGGDDVSEEKAVEKPAVEDKAVKAPPETKAPAPDGSSRQTGRKTR